MASCKNDFLCTLHTTAWYKVSPEVRRTLREAYPKKRKVTMMMSFDCKKTNRKCKTCNSFEQYWFGQMHALSDSQIGGWRILRWQWWWWWWWWWWWYIPTGSDESVMRTSNSFSCCRMYSKPSPIYWVSLGELYPFAIFGKCFLHTLITSCQIKKKDNNTMTLW